MIHFDAHADTGDIEFGSLWGHGRPMRRLIESGALRGDPLPPGRAARLATAADPPVDGRAADALLEMTEIVHRGLDERLAEAFAIATDECDGVFLSVDIDVCDPGHAPGTGTPSLAAFGPPAARCGPPDLPRAAGLRGSTSSRSPALRPRRYHRGVGQPGRPRGPVGHRAQAPGRARRHAVGPVAAPAVGSPSRGPPRSPALPLMPQPAPVCRWCARPPLGSRSGPRRPRPRRDLAHRHGRDSTAGVGSTPGARSSATSSYGQPGSPGGAGGGSGGRATPRSDLPAIAESRLNAQAATHPGPDPSPAAAKFLPPDGGLHEPGGLFPRQAFRVLPRVHRRHARIAGPRCPPHHRRRRWRPYYTDDHYASFRQIGRGHERTARGRRTTSPPSSASSHLMGMPSRSSRRAGPPVDPCGDAAAPGSRTRFGHNADALWRLPARLGRRDGTAEPWSSMASATWSARMPLDAPLICAGPIEADNPHNALVVVVDR